MNLNDFDYDLPPEQIASHPLPIRSQSRLMRLARHTGALSHHYFNQLPAFLRPGDLLVYNNTRVIPARLTGCKETGGRTEMLVERILDQHRVIAHVRGGGSLKVGAKLFFADAVFTLTARRDDLFELRYVGENPVAEVIDRLGEIPLPHYMHRGAEESDLERYQTVFAKHKGSVAAPTAGLHFDNDLLQILQTQGIQTAAVTLHIGAGTFAPVRTDDITQHKMHAEFVNVPASVCDLINQTKKQGGRVIAVGTTAARSLESAAISGQISPFSGDTSIFIYPGFTFRCIDALITNFHLPRSTLLMLVSAFAEKDSVMRAYQTAVAEKYRFYSYGDAMLII